jgi:AcrR family transcriptional regulator
MASEQAAVPTPAQRRKDRQRRLIVREARRLFEENGGEEGGGFEKTTAEAIAERSDISVSTFFRYFRTKADVIYLDLHNAIDEHLAAVERRLAEGYDVAGAVAEATVEVLRVHLPESHDRDLQASTTATVCLYTAWAAVQQWAAQGLDEPLEPIVTKAFGLAATAARDVQEAMRPERGKG